MNELNINEILAKEQADFYEVVPFHLARQLPKDVKSDREWWKKDNVLHLVPHTKQEWAMCMKIVGEQSIEAETKIIAPNASELLRYMAGKGFGVYVCYGTSELTEVPFEVEVVDKANKTSQTYRLLESKNLAELLAVALIEFVLPKLHEPNL
jgi:hypothetical protein